MPDNGIKARFDLPANMARDIGRLIIRYAYLEQYIQAVIYMVMGVDAGTGRLAVREPGRLTDKLALLLDLVAAKGLKWPDIDMKELREIIEDVMDMRNLCAHSTWMYSSEHHGWAVFVSRGVWDGIPKTERARRNKRLFPEGQIIQPQTLKTYVTGTSVLNDHFRKIQASLQAQLEASPQTHP
jgi:hypothetical protein